MSVRTSKRAADLFHLDRLYATTDDPWNFRTSAYEQARFDAILRVTSDLAPSSVLEIGCGNGELARHIMTPDCTYTGLDGATRAVEAARMAVPQGRIFELFLPAPLPEPWPGSMYDLIIVSEILYFLDLEGIADLARQISTSHARANILCVNYNGETGHLLSGQDAAAHFLDSFEHRPRRIAHLDEAGFSLSAYKQRRM